MLSLLDWRGFCFNGVAWSTLQGSLNDGPVGSLRICASELPLTGRISWVVATKKSCGMCALDGRCFFLPLSWSPVTCCVSVGHGPPLSSLRLDSFVVAFDLVAWEMGKSSVASGRLKRSFFSPSFLVHNYKFYNPKWWSKVVHVVQLHWTCDSRLNCFKRI